MTLTEHHVREYLRAADLCEIDKEVVRQELGISHYKMREADYGALLKDERLKRCAENLNANTLTLAKKLGFKNRDSARKFRAKHFPGQMGRYMVTGCPRDDIETIAAMKERERIGLPELSEKAGYSAKALQRYLRIYQEHGPEAFIPRDHLGLAKTEQQRSAA